MSKGITIEDVETAIAELEATGETPSVRKVRQQLRTGSLTTISKLMAALRLRNQESKQGNIDIPVELQELFKNIMNQLWKASQESAQKDIQKLRLALYEKAHNFEEVITTMQEATNKAEVHMQELLDIEKTSKK